MTSDGLQARIVAADRRWRDGEFAAGLTEASALLAEIGPAPAGPAASWQAQLLGLVARCALQLDRRDEALAAITESYRLACRLDDMPAWFVDALRETLLCVIAANEPIEAAAGHRGLRARIVEAQRLTDRHRLVDSTSLLEEVLAELRDVAAESGWPGADPADPRDTRVFYLPKVLGLLGFNLHHLGRLDAAAERTAEARRASAALGDSAGVRIYEANLAAVASAQEA